MQSTDKVLGTISAIDTFLENFPMSILDMSKGKTYTSVFDFVIDVLVACGVPMQEVSKWLLEQLYGLESKVDKGVEDIYERIKDGSLENIDQNEFIEGLEESIRVILMGLLSGIYTCSAIPVLPNKVFDSPCDDTFVGKDNKKDSIIKILQGKDNLGFKPFIVPKKMIDPMGLLDICPTSSDGRLYYDIEGGNKYYKKEKTVVEEVVTETKYSEKDTTVSEKYYVTVDKYSKQVKLYLKEADGTYADYDYYTFELSEAVNNDITITISYDDPHSPTQIFETTILKGTKNSVDSFRLIASQSDADFHENSTYLHSMSINNSTNGGVDVGNDTWVFLSKSESKDFSDKWWENGADYFPWSSGNQEKKQIESGVTKTIKKGEAYSSQTIVYKNKYVYNFINPENLNSDIKSKAKSVNAIPLDVSEDSSEFIVYYDGSNPNMLYKSNDMNAFIWYVLHKGMKTPQVEYNHMMWDSRLSAAKKGTIRRNPQEWNEWYATKANSSSEFLFRGKRITKKDDLFPIIQLEPQGMAENLLQIKLPSQRYFRPGVRKSILNPEKRDKKSGFNSTIYKFNWDYLRSIQILKPKILLVGMLEELLGFAVSTVKSANIDLTTKIIEAKLTTAIKSVVEANDMEVEDCFMQFSNDELNTMLDDMLLSRYTATQYGGETNVVRSHADSIDNYIGMIDQVSANASSHGTKTSINKLVTNVTVSGEATEPAIEYGLSLTTDGNILKKLLMAIVKPIIMSIFTPQVLLLLYINFELLGVTKTDNFITEDFGKIINFLMNKIFTLIKSIILFVKDKLIELLLRLIYVHILPKIIKWKALLVLEYITYWLAILQAALNCLPTFKFKLPKALSKSSIDEVDYADIIPSQDTPESTSQC